MKLHSILRIIFKRIELLKSSFAYFIFPYFQSVFRFGLIFYINCTRINEILFFQKCNKSHIWVRLFGQFCEPCLLI